MVAVAAASFFIVRRRSASGEGSVGGRSGDVDVLDEEEGRWGAGTPGRFNPAANTPPRSSPQVPMQPNFGRQSSQTGGLYVQPNGMQQAAAVAQHSGPRRTLSRGASQLQMEYQQQQLQQAQQQFQGRTVVNPAAGASPPQRR